jgi:NTE family protein
LTPLKSRTFCFVPADPAFDMRPMVEKIAASLESFGTVAMVSAEQAAGRPSAWFTKIERGSDFVLFQAECSPTAWTRFCLRQADRIVLLAAGDSEPANCDALGPSHTDVPHNTPLSLMLLWRDTIVPARTTEWLKLVNPGGHHHIRSSVDIERASRLIAGRGLGLVLSGGGAKALAHVGVIDALRQHDIQIDAVGGTSIGGIVAAVFALEWDLAATVRSLAAAFNRRRLSDFAVPRTALYSERAFARTLGHYFGDIAIEDSPTPLFCVSTNLTEGILSVHRTGRLATWLRATSAVPGICPPIMEQNAVYVDGGVLNNMPTEAIREFGVASAIAVDVGTSLEAQARSDGEYSLPNILDLLWRVGTIGSDGAANRMRRAGDVVLKPEVGSIGLFDWNAHERAIAAGHRVAFDHLDEIKAALVRIP